MADATIIKVMEKMLPKPGGKQGKVIDQTGKSWQVWENKLNDFQVGNMYRVDKIKASSFNGQQYFLIEQASPVTSDDFKAAAPVIEQQVAQQHQASTSKDKHIFVCGAFNNAIAANQVNINDGAGCVEAINKLMKVYAQTLGRKTITTGKELLAMSPARDRLDFNDSVEF